MSPAARYSGDRETRKQTVFHYKSESNHWTGAGHTPAWMPESKEEWVALRVKNPNYLEWTDHFLTAIARSSKIGRLLLLESLMQIDAEYIGKVVAGGCAVIGAAISFFLNGFDIVDMAITAAGAAFIGYFFSFIFALILEGAIDSAKEESNPFAKGVKFVSFVIFALCAFDAALMRGTFIILPVIAIGTNQSLEGTFWKCDRWESVEEGSYCADE